MIQRLALICAAAVSVAAVTPPDLDGPDDGKLHFPALETTLRAPEVDHGRMLRCSVLEAHRLCDDDLGEAWCRKQGFGGGFVRWTTSAPVDKARCAPDARACTPVETITCRGVPIVGD